MKGQKGSQQIHDEQKAAERDKARRALLKALDQVLKTSLPFAHAWVTVDDITAMHAVAIDHHANALYQSLRKLAS